MKHVTGPAELGYVERALASGHTSGDGEFTRKATELLAAKLGVEARSVLLTTSCTHALELAALLLRTEPGDEVVMPSYTFPSTANAFALRGARIRFADVDRGTFSMELPELEAALTPRSRVVVAVPYGGVMRDIAAMRELCAERSLDLIEDAAHALFATAGGKPFGTFGQIGALSFHSSKNVSCGEGGAILLNDATLEERALVLREKGTDRTRFLRGEVDRYTWQEIGSSYLPSDVLAAILLAQLENADATQKQRQRIWRAYRDALAPRAAELGFDLQEIPAGVHHPAHLFAVLVPAGVDRDAVLRGLRESSVHAVSHYEPLHVAPARATADSEDLPVTGDIAGRLVRLPLHAAMKKEDALRGARALIAMFEAAAKRKP